MRFHRCMQAQCSLTNFSSSENVSVWIILPPAAELLRCLDVGAGKQHARVRSSSRLMSIRCRMAMDVHVHVSARLRAPSGLRQRAASRGILCGAPASKFVLFVSCEWGMLARDVCYNHVCCTVILITSSSSSSLILSVGLASRRVNESGDMDVLQFRLCFLLPRIRRGSPFKQVCAVLISGRRPYVQRDCLSCDVALLRLLLIHSPEQRSTPMLPEMALTMS
jgi:hypothetical protein